MRGVVRKKSSSAAQERDDVAQQVAHEATARQTLLSRKNSAYLPAQGELDARVATGAIQTIYAIHQCYDRRRVVDNGAFAVAMIGILLVLIDNEYASSRLATQLLRSANVALTIALLGLIMWRYNLERELLIRRNALPPHTSIFRTPKRLLCLLTELVVCAICVPPGVDGSFTVSEWKYYLDDTHRATNGCRVPFHASNGSCYMVYDYSYKVLGLAALLRLYMVPRVLIHLSKFTSYRTSYLGALHHVDTQSSLFALKCLLQAYPFRLLILGFSATLLLTSYALAIVEAPVNPTLVPLGNAMWLVVLTMGTIGYGDVNAVTLPGQIVLIVGGMLMGILLFGVLSSALFSFLTLSDRDHRLLFLLRQREHDERLRQACALTIQGAWRYSQASRRQGGGCLDALHADRCRTALFKHLAVQRRLRLDNGDVYRSVATELQQCQDQILRTLQAEHRSTMRRLHAVDKRLDAMLEAVATQ